MTYSRRQAQDYWTRTRPMPTTYANFIKLVNEAQNEEAVEQMILLAEPDDLRALVRDLRRRLAGAEFAARINQNTIRALRGSR